MKQVDIDFNGRAFTLNYTKEEHGNDFTYVVYSNDSYLNEHLEFPFKFHDSYKDENDRSLIAIQETDSQILVEIITYDILVSEQKGNGE